MISTFFVQSRFIWQKQSRKKKDSLGKNLGDYYPEEKVKKAINNQCIKKKGEENHFCWSVVKLCLYLLVYDKYIYAFASYYCFFITQKIAIKQSGVLWCLLSCSNTKL
jgi:hypothetical protein